MGVCRFAALFLMLFLAACSSTVIKPNPANNHAQIEGDWITLQHQQLTVKIKLQDVSIRPSPVEQNYCSFLVEIENQRHAPLSLEITDFSLISGDGHKHLPVPSEEIVALLTEAIPYLVPSPYVGFYYLQDWVRSAENNQARSEGYYFASRRPEYLNQDALPAGSIMPQKRAGGALYFPVELRNQNHFRIKYLAGGSPEQKPVVFDFPFLVEKK